jgi:hypothetical protein
MRHRFVFACRPFRKRATRARPVVLCAALLGVCGAAGCSHAEPPTPDASPFVARAPASALEPSGSPPADAAPSPGATAPLPVAKAPSPAAAPASTVPETGSPPTASDSSSALGQTQDMPSADGASFRAHAALLWRAIADDNPDAAMPLFFPLGAYQQVKDVGDPAADWNHRLVAAFRHDIHALHAKLGADATAATFVSLDVPSGRARWVLPGEEWNKIGYYRVFGAKIRYGVNGEAHTFDVKSLISWRGEWFVVHLSAIR